MEGGRWKVIIIGPNPIMDTLLLKQCVFLPAASLKFAVTGFAILPVASTILAAIYSTELLKRKLYKKAILLSLRKL